MLMRVLHPSRVCVILVLALFPAVAAAQDVLTNRYDNGRTGATTTPNLDASVFRRGAWRRHGELKVDGRVYAQPLYVAGLQMPNGSRHDVVFIVTSQNKVYAFDAQSLAPLWGPTKLGQNDTSLIGNPKLGCDWISPDGIGNQATPVIDRRTGKMYVTYRINTSLKENDPFGARERLAAIDIRTGARVAPGVDVTAPGFDPVWQRSRASLLLFQGVVYVAYGSRCEDIPTFRGRSTRFHGWIFGFDPNTLQRVIVYQVTPQNIDGGGIWQASAGMAADEQSIYFISGNRFFDRDGQPPMLETLANSVIRLAPQKDSLRVVDWFTPYRRIWMDATDLDLGSAGPVLVPDSPYLIAGGKQGLLYVIDRNKMGGLDTAHMWTPVKWDAVFQKKDATSFDEQENFAADHVVQKLRVGFNQFIPDYPAYLAIPGGSIDTAKQLDDQLDVFSVGRDGAIYVTWEHADGPWSDGGTVAGYNRRPLPARITPPNLAPRDAVVTSAKQTPNQLDAFWVGNDGAISVTWVAGAGQWTDGVAPAGSPVRITPPGFAKPGACIAAAQQTDNQLDLFVVRDDGAVWVTWVTGTGHWSDGTPGNASPARITPTGYATPGACIAAARQTDNQLDVFFVRGDGAVYVTWVAGTGHWTDGSPSFPAPARITPTGLAPAGAHVAAAKQTANQLDVFVIGNDGAVYVTWVVGTGAWSAVPARITPTNMAPTGAAMAASEQVPGQLDVVFVDNAGAMRVTWVVGTGFLSDGAGGRPAPAHITPDGLLPPGAGVAAKKQNANVLNAFAVGHDGAIRMTSVAGTNAWNPPVRLSRALWMGDWVEWPHIHGTPVFARFPNGSATLYIWPEKDHLKALPWTGSKLNDAGKKLAVAIGGGLALAPDGMPGGMLAVSVDPTKPRAGIVFAALSRDNATDGPGILRAYDADTLEELWNNAGEETYRFSKFVQPTIAGGKLFLPTCSNKVIVYGR
jgi:hypothetical protein